MILAKQNSPATCVCTTVEKNDTHTHKKKILCLCYLYRDGGQGTGYRVQGTGVEGNETYGFRLPRLR